MVFELRSAQFCLNAVRFEITCHFGPKSLEMKSNYHFIEAILKLKYFITQIQALNRYKYFEIGKTSYTIVSLSFRVLQLMVAVK